MNKALVLLTDIEIVLPQHRKPFFDYFVNFLLSSVGLVDIYE